MRRKRERERERQTDSCYLAPRTRAWAWISEMSGQIGDTLSASPDGITRTAMTPHSNPELPESAVPKSRGNIRKA